MRRRQYDPRARRVEKATLTAVVMSTSGGMGKEMDTLVRQIATKLSVQRGERYSDTVGFLKRRLRFDLLLPLSGERRAPATRLTPATAHLAALS